MISRVTIENFKSIEKAAFDARRVNVFIGEPNSGKSNILEAIAFQSPEVHGRLREICRITQMAELFFDRELDRVVKITTAPEWNTVLGFEKGDFRARFTLPEE